MVSNGQEAVTGVFSVVGFFLFKESEGDKNLDNTVSGIRGYRDKTYGAYSGWRRGYIWPLDFSPTFLPLNISLYPTCTPFPSSLKISLRSLISISSCKS